MLLLLVSDSDPKQIQIHIKPNFYLLAWYKQIVGRMGNALKGDPFISMILWQVINSEQCCSQCTVPAVPIIQLIDFFQSLFSAYHSSGFSQLWRIPCWQARNLPPTSDVSLLPLKRGLSSCRPAFLHRTAPCCCCLYKAVFVPHKGKQNKPS